MRIIVDGHDITHHAFNVQLDTPTGGTRTLTVQLAERVTGIGGGSSPST